jgi:hypothetical protein
MQVTVKGGRKFQKELLVQFTLWAGYKLLGNRLGDRCQIDIHLKKCRKAKDILGSCIGIDDHILPRHFYIEVEKTQTPKMLLQTLGHELTHAKQFALGELKYPKRNLAVSKWKGESITDSDIDYWDMPWEIEAHGREIGLYMQFIEYMEILPQFKSDSPEYTDTPKIYNKAKLLINGVNK